MFLTSLRTEIRLESENGRLRPSEVILIAENKKSK